MTVTFYKEFVNRNPITFFIDDIVAIEYKDRDQTVIYTKGAHFTVKQTHEYVVQTVSDARKQRDKLVEENRQLRAMIQNVPVEYLRHPLQKTSSNRPRPEPDKSSGETPF